ncbi:MAG: hypothetical protein KGK07_13505 [Chloroflexota bacterium]|nr:hypothetical protein [Chloroflexota bacterium]
MSMVPPAAGPPVQDGASAAGPGSGLTIRWLGALFGLWLILMLLSAPEGTRDLAVALAWLIAVSALYVAADRQHGNLFGTITGG